MSIKYLKVCINNSIQLFENELNEVNTSLVLPLVTALIHVNIWKMCQVV